MGLLSWPTTADSESSECYTWKWECAEGDDQGISPPRETSLSTAPFWGLLLVPQLANHKTVSLACDRLQMVDFTKQPQKSQW